MSEDTGTLEARLQDAMKFYDYNGGMVDLLRDALTELRRLRAEIAINKHARALSLLGRSSEQEAREEGLREKLAEAEIRAEQAEARASSPDLRALLAGWDEVIETSDLSGDAESARASRMYARGVKRCRLELEASLTGTGEQK